MARTDHEIILGALIVFESMSNDMLEEYSSLPNWREEYKDDIAEIKRLREIITEKGGIRSKHSTMEF